MKLINLQRSFHVGRIRKGISLVVIACFLINTLMSTGFALNREELKETKDKGPAYLTMEGQYVSPNQANDSIARLPDEGENKVYLINTITKVVIGFEDMRTGLTTIYERNSSGNIVEMKVFDKNGQEVDMRKRGKSKGSAETASQENAIAPTTWQETIGAITDLLTNAVNNKLTDAQKALLEKLGISDVAGLTKEKVEGIINYLKTQGEKVFNCAVSALDQVFGGAVNKALLALQSLVVDIFTGNLDTNTPGDQIKLSMFAMQQVAKANGRNLNGYATNIDGLAESLKGGETIAFVNNNHFVTVTGMNGTSVIYTDSDGTSRTVTREKWNAMWEGQVLSSGMISSKNGKQLSAGDMQKIKGAYTQGDVDAFAAENGMTSAQVEEYIRNNNITDDQVDSFLAQYNSADATTRSQMVSDLNLPAGEQTPPPAAEEPPPPPYEPPPANEPPPQDDAWIQQQVNEFAYQNNLDANQVMEYVRNNNITAEQINAFLADFNSADASRKSQMLADIGVTLGNQSPPSPAEQPPLEDPRIQQQVESFAQANNLDISKIEQYIRDNNISGAQIEAWLTEYNSADASGRTRMLAEAGLSAMAQTTPSGELDETMRQELETFAKDNNLDISKIEELIRSNHIDASQISAWMEEYKNASVERRIEMRQSLGLEAKQDAEAKDKGLLTQEEFYRTYNAVFKAAMGRDATEEDMKKLWAEYLDGTGLDELTKRIVKSEDFNNLDSRTQISRLVHGLLGRDITDAEMNRYLDRVNRFEITLEDIAKEIIGGDEFKGKDAGFQRFVTDTLDLINVLHKNLKAEEQVDGSIYYIDVDRSKYAGTTIVDHRLTTSGGKDKAIYEDNRLTVWENPVTGEEFKPKTAAQMIVDGVEYLLDQFLKGDEAKKAEVAASLGLPIDQLANLSAESAKKIIDYLKSQGDRIVNCGTEAFVNLAGALGKATDELMNRKDWFTRDALLVDILTGTLNDQTYNWQVQTSMFAIKTVAEKQFDVHLDGYKSATLEEIAKAGAPVIANVGGNHFVTITSIRDGIVTYTDSDGKSYTKTEEEFNRWFSGNVLSTGQINDKAMSIEEMQTVRGAENLTQEQFLYEFKLMFKNIMGREISDADALNWYRDHVSYGNSMGEYARRLVASGEFQQKSSLEQVQTVFQMVLDRRASEAEIANYLSRFETLDITLEQIARELMESDEFKSKSTDFQGERRDLWRVADAFHRETRTLDDGTVIYYSDWWDGRRTDYVKRTDGTVTRFVYNDNKHINYTLNVQTGDKTEYHYFYENGDTDNRFKDNVWYTKNVTTGDRTYYQRNEGWNDQMRVDYVLTATGERIDYVYNPNNNRYVDHTINRTTGERSNYEYDTSRGDGDWRVRQITNTQTGDITHFDTEHKRIDYRISDGEKTNYYYDDSAAGKGRLLHTFNETTHEETWYDTTHAVNRISYVITEQGDKITYHYTNDSDAKVDYTENETTKERIRYHYYDNGASSILEYTQSELTSDITHFDRDTRQIDYRIVDGQKIDYHYGDDRRLQWTRNETTNETISYYYYENTRRVERTESSLTGNVTHFDRTTGKVDWTLVDGQKTTYYYNETTRLLERTHNETTGETISYHYYDNSRNVEYTESSLTGNITHYDQARKVDWTMIDGQRTNYTYLDDGRLDHTYNTTTGETISYHYYGSDDKIEYTQSSLTGDITHFDQATGKIDYRMVDGQKIEYHYTSTGLLDYTLNTTTNEKNSYNYYEGTNRIQFVTNSLTGDQAHYDYATRLLDYRMVDGAKITYHYHADRKLGHTKNEVTGEVIAYNYYEGTNRIEYTQSSLTGNITHYDRMTRDIDYRMVDGQKIEYHYTSSGLLDYTLNTTTNEKNSYNYYEGTSRIQFVTNSLTGDQAHYDYATRLLDYRMVDGQRIEYHYTSSGLLDYTLNTTTNEKNSYNYYEGTNRIQFVTNSLTGDQAYYDYATRLLDYRMVDGAKIEYHYTGTRLLDYTLNTTTREKIEYHYFEGTNRMEYIQSSLSGDRTYYNRETRLIDYRLIDGAKIEYHYTGTRLLDYTLNTKTNEKIEYHYFEGTNRIDYVRSSLNGNETHYNRETREIDYKLIDGAKIEYHYTADGKLDHTLNTKTQERVDYHYFEGTNRLEYIQSSLTGNRIFYNRETRQIDYKLIDGAKIEYHYTADRRLDYTLNTKTNEKMEYHYAVNSTGGPTNRITYVKNSLSGDEIHYNAITREIDYRLVDGQKIEYHYTADGKLDYTLNTTTNEKMEYHYFAGTDRLDYIKSSMSGNEIHYNRETRQIDYKLVNGAKIEYHYTADGRLDFMLNTTTNEKMQYHYAVNSTGGPTDRITFVKSSLSGNETHYNAITREIDYKLIDGQKIEYHYTADGKLDYTFNTTTQERIDYRYYAGTDRLESIKSSLNGNETHYNRDTRQIDYRLVNDQRIEYYYTADGKLDYTFNTTTREKIEYHYFAGTDRLDYIKSNLSGNETHYDKDTQRVTYKIVNGEKIEYYYTADGKIDYTLNTSTNEKETYHYYAGTDRLELVESQNGDKRHYDRETGRLDWKIEDGQRINYYYTADGKLDRTYNESTKETISYHYYAGTNLLEYRKSDKTGTITHYGKEKQRIDYTIVNNEKSIYEYDEKNNLKRIFNTVTQAETVFNLDVRLNDGSHGILYRTDGKGNRLDYTYERGGKDGWWIKSIVNKQTGEATHFKLVDGDIQIDYKINDKGEKLTYTYQGKEIESFKNEATGLEVHFDLSKTFSDGSHPYAYVKLGNAISRPIYDGEKLVGWDGDVPGFQQPQPRPQPQPQLYDPRPQVPRRSAWKPFSRNKAWAKLRNDITREFAVFNLGKRLPNGNYAIAYMLKANGEKRVPVYDAGGNIIKWNTVQAGVDKNSPASTQILNMLKIWLNDFQNADADKRAEMAASLGISQDKLAEFSKAKAEDILAYLEKQGDKIINCAIKALENVTGITGVTELTKEFAKRAILTDILTGNLKTTSDDGYDADKLQLSMFAVQKAAESVGIKLNGYQTDLKNLSDLVNSGDRAIAHLDFGGGRGDFVTVIAVKDGQVTFINDAGETISMSEAEFKSKWTGNMLTEREAEDGNGVRALSDSEMMDTKGADYEEDPGYEDPGYEDPGYEDPGYEDPGYEEPAPEPEPEPEPFIDPPQIPEQDPNSAGAAGDRAWNEAKAAGLSDEEARMRAEWAYNDAANHGAFVPWARDDQGNMVNLDSIGDSINRAALADGTDNINGVGVTDYSRYVVDTLFDASQSGYAPGTEMLNDIRTPDLSATDIGTMAFNDDNYIGFVEDRLDDNFSFNHDDISMNAWGFLDQGIALDVTKDYEFQSGVTFLAGDHLVTDGSGGFGEGSYGQIRIDDGAQIFDGFRTDVLSGDSAILDFKDSFADEVLFGQDLAQEVTRSGATLMGFSFDGVGTEIQFTTEGMAGQMNVLNQTGDIYFKDGSRLSNGLEAMVLDGSDRVVLDPGSDHIIDIYNDVWANDNLNWATGNGTFEMLNAEIGPNTVLHFNKGDEFSATMVQVGDFIKVTDDGLMNLMQIDGHSPSFADGSHMVDLAPTFSAGDILNGGTLFRHALSATGGLLYSTNEMQELGNHLFLAADSRMKIDENGDIDVLYWAEGSYADRGARFGVLELENKTYLNSDMSLREGGVLRVFEEGLWTGAQDTVYLAVGSRLSTGPSQSILYYAEGSFADAGTIYGSTVLENRTYLNGDGSLREGGVLRIFKDGMMVGENNTVYLEVGSKLATGSAGRVLYYAEGSYADAGTVYGNTVLENKTYLNGDGSLRAGGVLRVFQEGLWVGENEKIYLGVGSRLTTGPDSGVIYYANGSFADEGARFGDFLLTKRVELENNGDFKGKAIAEVVAGDRGGTYLDGEARKIFLTNESLVDLKNGNITFASAGSYADEGARFGDYVLLQRSYFTADGGFGEGARALVDVEIDKTTLRHLTPEDRDTMLAIANTEGGKTTYIHNGAIVDLGAQQIISGRVTTIEGYEMLGGGTLEIKSVAHIDNREVTSITADYTIFGKDSIRAVENQNQIINLVNGNAAIFARNPEGSGFARPDFLGMFSTERTNASINAAGDLLLTGEVKKVQSLSLYGSLSISADGKDRVSDFDRLEGTIRGEKVSIQLAMNEKLGYFEATSGQNQTFHGTYRDSEIDFQIKGVDASGDNIIAGIGIGSGVTLEGITIRPEDVKGGGAGGAGSDASYETKYVLGITNGTDENTWNIKNEGDGNALFNGTLSLAEAASGNITGIGFVSFEQGTLVKAGEGGFSYRLNFGADAGVSATRFVTEGTQIEIHKTGGISENIQYMISGEIKDIFDISQSRSTMVRDIEVNKDGQVVSKNAPGEDSRVYIGNKYIDLASTGFELHEQTFAQQLSNKDLELNANRLESVGNGLYRVTDRIEYVDANGSSKWLSEGSLITKEGGVVKNTNFEKNVIEPLQTIPGVKGAGDLLEGIGKLAGDIGGGALHWGGRALGFMGELGGKAADFASEQINNLGQLATDTWRSIENTGIGKGITAAGQLLNAGFDLINDNKSFFLDNSVGRILLPVVAPVLVAKNLGTIAGAIGDGVQAVLSGAGNVLGAIGNFVLKDVPAFIGNAWNTTVFPVLDGVANLINDNKGIAMAIGAAVPVLQPLITGALVAKNWDSISKGMGDIWNNAIVPAWNGFIQNDTVKAIGGALNSFMTGTAQTILAPINAAAAIGKQLGLDTWLDNNIVDAFGLQSAVDAAKFGAMMVMATTTPMGFTLIPYAMNNTETGKAISGWIDNNRAGLVTAAAIGGGGGALVGGPVGALIGVVGSVGMYALGNILAGGKGGGFSDNQILDGAINGVITVATLGTGTIAAAATRIGASAAQAGIIGRTAVSVLKFMNPFSLATGERAAGLAAGLGTKLLGGAARVESLTSTFGLGGLARFGINTAGTALKFGVPMAKNALLYGQFGAIPGLPSFSGLLPEVLKAMTGKDITLNPVYKAVANMAFFAPFLAGGMAGKQVAKAAQGGKGSLAGTIRKGLDKTLEGIIHPRQTLTSVSRQGMVDAGKKVLSLDTMGSGVSAMKKDWLGTLRGIGSEMGENFVNLAPRTAQMVSDIAVFNTVTGFLGGTVNTLLGGEERQWWIFQLPKFDGWLDAVVKTSEITQKSITDPQIWSFSGIIGALNPLLSPLLRNTPVLGPAMRFIGDKNVFVGGRLAEGRLGRFQGFIYEEGFQEQIPEFMAGGLFGGNQQASEIFQELFDRRGGANRYRMNSNTASTSLGNGYIDTVNNLSSTRGNNLDTAIAAMNATLVQRGLNDIRIVNTSGNNTMVSIVQNSGEVLVPGVQINNVNELKNFMTSLGAASLTYGGQHNFNIADAIELNNRVLGQSKVYHLDRLSAEQKVDFLVGAAGVNSLPGVAGFATGNGVRVTADEAAGVLNQEGGVGRLEAFIRGVLPVVGETRDAAFRVPLFESVENSLAALVERADTTALGTQEISLLAGLGMSIADSPLPVAERQSLLSRYMVSLKQSIAGLDFSRGDTQLETDLIRNRFGIVDNLQGLGNALADIGDTNLRILYTSAFLSNPQLLEMVKRYAVIHQNDPETADKEPSIPTMVLNTLYGANVDTVLKNIGMLDNMGLPEADAARVKASVTNGLSQIMSQRLRNNAPLNSDDIRTLEGLVGVMESLPADAATMQDVAQSLLALEGLLHKPLSSRTKATAAAILARLRDIVETKKKDAAIGQYVEAAKAQIEEVLGGTRRVNSELQSKIDKIYAEYTQSESRGDEAAAVAARKVADELYVRLLGTVRGKFNAHQRELLEKFLLGQTNDNEEKELAQAAAESKIPFGIGLLRDVDQDWHSFSKEQQKAFTDIFKALFAEGGSENLSDVMTRYAHQLQTAGGKTVIGLYTAMLLSLKKTDPNKFIGWMTNEEGNVKDLAAHIQMVFGTDLGRVLLLDKESAEKLEKAGKLRGELENTDLVLTTYSQWSSLYSLAIARLLAYDEKTGTPEEKAIAEHNRKVLAENGIALEKEKDANGETSRVRLKTPADSHKAVRLLLAIGLGLDSTGVPLQRIGDAIADELDYAATIPSSALATYTGKYTKVSSMVDYYTRLAEGRDVKIEEYQEVGITEAMYNADLGRTRSALGKVELQKMASFFSALSEKIEGAVIGGAGTARKLSNEEIRKLVEEAAGLEGGNRIAPAMLEKVIRVQAENVRALSFFRQILPGVQKLARSHDTDKGSMAIKGEGSLDGQVHVDESDTTNLKASLSAAVLGDAVKQEDQIEAPNEEKQIAEGEKLTDKQLREEVDRLVEEYYQKYGELFSKAQIREQIIAGMSAVELFDATRRQTGTGAYAVINGEVKITNNGEPVENLSMPGMWALELLEGLGNLTRPTKETFISNSAEAINAWNSVIGFSGTFSASVRHLLADLNFGEVGGGIGSGLTVGVHSALVKTQKVIGTTIVETTKNIEKDGAAVVNLVLTPNFDITDMVVNTIISRLTAQGFSEEQARKQIVSLSLTGIDAQLEGFGEKAEEIERLTTASKLKKLQEILKREAKSGNVKYIIGDAYLLGRGWNVGKMGEAVNNLKELYKKEYGNDPVKDKVQATLWLVNMNQMDGDQLEQALGRIDHRSGETRLSQQYYDRGVVQITSVESAREQKALREAAKKNGGYSIDVIVDNLSTVMAANERQKLEKAGQKVLVAAQRTWEEQHRQAPPKAAEAVAQLQAKGLSNVQAKQVLSDIGASKNDAPLTVDQWYKLDTVVRYYALLGSLLNNADLSDQNLFSGLSLSREEIAQLIDQPGSLLGLALKKAQSAGVERNEDVASAFKNIDKKLKKLSEMKAGIRDGVSRWSQKAQAEMQASVSRISDENAGVLEKMSAGIALAVKHPVMLWTMVRVGRLENSLRQVADTLARELVTDAVSRDGGSVNRAVDTAAVLAGIRVDDEGKVTFDEKAIQSITGNETRELIVNALRNIKQLFGETVPQWNNVGFAELLSSLKEGDIAGLVEDLAGRNENSLLRRSGRALPLALPVAASIALPFVGVPSLLAGAVFGIPGIVKMLTKSDLFDINAQMMNGWNRFVDLFQKPANAELLEMARGFSAIQAQAREALVAQNEASLLPALMMQAMQEAQQQGREFGQNELALLQQQVHQAALRRTAAPGLTMADIMQLADTQANAGNREGFIKQALQLARLASSPADSTTLTAKYDSIRVVQGEEFANTLTLAQLDDVAIGIKANGAPTAALAKAFADYQKSNDDTASPAASTPAEQKAQKEMNAIADKLLASLGPDFEQKLEVLGSDEEISVAGNMVLASVGEGRHAKAVAVKDKGGNIVAVVKLVEKGQKDAVLAADALLNGQNSEVAKYSLKELSSGSLLVIQTAGETVKERVNRLLREGKVEEAGEVVSRAITHIKALEAEGLVYNNSDTSVILGNMGFVFGESGKVVNFDFPNLVKGASAKEAVKQVLQEAVEENPALSVAAYRQINENKYGRYVLSRIVNPLLRSNPLVPSGITLRDLALVSKKVKDSIGVEEEKNGYQTGSLTWSTAQKTLLERVIGVMRPGEETLGIKALLSMGYKTDDLFNELGFRGPSDLPADAAARKAAVLTQYLSQTQKVVQYVKEGKLAANEGEVELVLLETIKDVLWTGEAQKAFEALAKNSDTAAFSKMVSLIAQNRNDESVDLLAFAGELNKSIAAGKSGKESPAIYIDQDIIEGLKEAIEAKHAGGWFIGLWRSIRAELGYERTLEEKMKDVLGYDFTADMGSMRDENRRILSPLGALAVAQAA